MPYDSRVASLLEVGCLAAGYETGAGGLVEAVRGVSFEVEPGEAVGLLGASGCGKSTLLQAIAGALPPSGRVTGGRVLFGGARMALVFQDSVLALNPVRRVGAQIEEVARAHGRPRAEARAATLAGLAEVGFTEPARIAAAYPHELSGGQRQRVAIAQALAVRPALLLADEPTSALDTVTQAELVSLLARLQERHGLALLVASHDLGALSALARRVLVMEAGRIVESGPPARVFARPAHPCTRGLVQAWPRPPAAPARGVAHGA